MNDNMSKLKREALLSLAALLSARYNMVFKPEHLADIIVTEKRVFNCFKKPKPSLGGGRPKPPPVPIIHEHTHYDHHPPSLDEEGLEGGGGDGYGVRRVRSRWDERP